MKDYQKRMIAEFKELGEKRAKLDAFMESEEFKKVPVGERNDMAMQLATMECYEKALFSRLQRAGMNFDAFKHEMDEESQNEEKKPAAACPPLQSKESSEAPKNSEGFVDLGLPSGVLWAEENAEGFFTFDDAVAEFGDSLPSARHMAELYECCVWAWDGERKGYEVTGPNGNAIFLPAAGYRSRNSSEVSCVGSEGNYWTRCPDKYSAANGRYLDFYSGVVYPLSNGNTVRTASLCAPSENQIRTFNQSVCPIFTGQTDISKSIQEHEKEISFANHLCFHFRA